MASNIVRTRFAPSPTGYMHVGNLRTALYAFLKAKSAGGTFILRIEDTDQERYVEGAVDIIYNTLRETGLIWDEGPDIGGPVGPYVQSERMGMFKGYAEQLVKEGKAYYCFCDKDDQILIKTDGMPTYNFANVVDDHLMGITHVIRGSEYLSSTPKYNLLYKDFGWDIPTYIHCPPVMKDAQNKLSKRNGDASYQDLVAKGYLKEAVLNYILLLGWSPKGEREIFTLPEMIEVFDESGIGKAPAIFDPAKLRYINAEYIRAMSEEAFFEKAEPYIDSVVKTPCNKALLAQVLHQRCELMSDIPEQIDFIDEMPEYDLAMYTNKKMKTTAETAKEALEAILPVLEAIPADGFTRDAVHAALFALIEEKGVKNGFMLWPLRVAVSGKQFTPGGGIELAAVLGKEKAVARVKAAIQRL